MISTIRDARAEDEAVGGGALAAAYLTFYDHPLPKTTAFTWARLMSPDPALNMRLAVNGPRHPRLRISISITPDLFFGRATTAILRTFVDEAQRGGAVVSAGR
ncbi:MAG: hypothetical protein R3D46_06270 [Defluviimonas denitrificans]